MAWLTGWKYRIKFETDPADVTGVLTDFPILVHLSSSCGRNSEDLTVVFDVLQADANRKKIAITTEDGVTQCYVEIELWDDANEEAWLHFKAPSVSSTVATVFYLYFDKSHPDNVDYVGDINSTPGANVWDTDFMMVHHMIGATLADLDDSTSNNHDVDAEGGTPTYNAASKVARGVDYVSADSENNRVPDAPGLDGFTVAATFEALVRIDAMPGDTGAHTYLNKYSTVGNQRAWLTELYKEGAVNDPRWRFYFAPDGGACYIAVCGPEDAAIGVGNWYHVMWVWTPNAQPKLYVNGVAKTVTNFAKTCADWTTPEIHDSTDPLYFALCTFDLNRDWDGIIDEARISDVERSAAYAKATYETLFDDFLDFWKVECRGFWRLKPRGGDHRSKTCFRKNLQIK